MGPTLRLVSLAASASIVKDGTKSTRSSCGLGIVVRVAKGLPDTRHQVTNFFLLVLGGFALFMVLVQQPSIKLLLGGAVLYAITRLMWSFSRA